MLGQLRLRRLCGMLVWLVRSQSLRRSRWISGGSEWQAELRSRGCGCLDHLGVGAAINGKTIYSGAMDDASGVATVLETAKTFSQAKERPKRSILFVVFTAEEKGLLGSRYFAGHPTVPDKAMAADLNLD